MSKDSNGFTDGLRHHLREEISKFSRGNDGAAVFWVGLVMDDKDDLKMGRVWVFLPGYHVSGPDATMFPSWKGTAPDKRGESDQQYDSSLRSNWVLCYPAGSFSGSDEFRAEFANDGRNAYSGNVNSYGDWYQPRIGDHVSVILMNGDPSRAYWTGMLPKLNQTGMVPGLAGTPREQVTSNDLTTRTKTGAKLPSYDSTANPALPLDGYSDTSDTPNSLTQTVPGSVNAAPNQTSSATNPGTSSSFKGGSNDTGGTQTSPDTGNNPTVLPVNSSGRNTVLGGHAYDDHRGQGSSASNRESPSYVTGRKSAGWLYDTEQFNQNTLGSGRFSDEREKYRHKNTPGHQFIMDDHPDSQMMRLRSSGGAQVMLNDSGTTPYIYLSTPKGNAWIEIADDGNIMIYAEESILMHSKKDISFTADRSIMMECGQDLNIFSHNDIRVTSGADTAISINGSLKQMILGGKDEHIQGGYSLSVQGPFGTTVVGTVAWQADKWSECIGGDRISDVGGLRYDMTSGAHSIEADQINLNCGYTAEHETPKSADLPKFPELTKKPGVPQQDDIEQNKRADKVKYLAARVPQHQPWPGRTGMNTAGTTGSVGPEAVVSSGTPSVRDSGLGGSIGECDFTGAVANVRDGAANPKSLVPDSIIGSRKPSEPTMNYVGMAFTTILSYLSSSAASNGSGNLSGIWQGNSYQTTNASETPTYSLVRYLAPGEIAPASGFTTTDETRDYIKTHNGLTQYVIVGPNNILEIGYGHQIQLGETIGGATFDSALIQEYIQTGGDDKMIYLSIADANDLFDQDLSEVETYLSSTITGSVTQSQFDALSSFIYHLGLSQVQTGNLGSDVIDALNQGRTDIAVARISNYVYVNGIIDPNTLERRRDERELMGNLVDDGMSYGLITPTGTPVSLGQFLVDPGVKTAIDQACTDFEVDPIFAYVMCAQLSGFNPTAQNTRSGAKGLFMLTTTAATVYSVLGNEFDPTSNAQAGINYISDAKVIFNEQNGRDPTALELYTSMFLGQVEGSQYPAILANNPGGDAAVAVDSLVPGLSVQYKPLLYKADGTSRTNAEFVGYLNSVLSERMASFS